METENELFEAEATLGDEVVGWRRGQLLAAGFELPVAETVASDCRVDLHALIELVERGCPPGLAARILAPLEDETKPC